MRCALALLSTALVFISCAGNPPASRQMSDGERLYRANCASCHSLRNPRNYTDEEWIIYLDKYGGKIPLDSLSRAKILDYLQSSN